jgi:hypothetical protein
MSLGEASCKRPWREGGVRSVRKPTPPGVNRAHFPSGVGPGSGGESTLEQGKGVHHLGFLELRHRGIEAAAVIEVVRPDPALERPIEAASVEAAVPEAGSVAPTADPP